MKTFIEIGTCDFDTCKKLAENGWHGIMIEPNPIPFKNMDNFMSGYDNIIRLNVAVSDYDGTIAMGMSKYDHKDKDVKGISSIVADSHKGTKVFEYNALSRTYLDKIVNVPCKRLDTIIYENQITQIDFLKIDVEGHETNIIEDYSWDVKPTFIKMEHKHIDDVNAVRILEQNGYLTWTEHQDIYAIR